MSTIQSICPVRSQPVKWGPIKKNRMFMERFGIVFKTHCSVLFVSYMTQISTSTDILSSFLWAELCQVYYWQDYEDSIFPVFLSTTFLEVTHIALVV